MADTMVMDDIVQKLSDESRKKYAELIEGFDKDREELAKKAHIGDWNWYKSYVIQYKHEPENMKLSDFNDIEEDKDRIKNILEDTKKAEVAVTEIAVIETEQVQAELEVITTGDSQSFQQA